MTMTITTTAQPTTAPDSTSAPKRARRMARAVAGAMPANGASNSGARNPDGNSAVEPALAAASPSRPPNKLDLVAAMLRAAEGASIAEIMTATGWQQHSVRGAIAGALKKRGLIITSDKIDGTRRYSVSSLA